MHTQGHGQALRGHVCATSTCVRDSRAHRATCTQIPAHIPIPDHARTSPPQFFLSPDLSPPIPEATLALPTQPRREDSKLSLFTLKKPQFALPGHALGKCLCRGKLMGDLLYLLNSGPQVHLPSVTDTLALTSGKVFPSLTAVLAPLSHGLAITLGGR